MSSDETSSTYRFETCHPSGDLCTGAFKNADGADVLISFKRLDDLRLNHAEYNAVKKEINRQTLISDDKYKSTTRGSKLFYGAGIISTAAGTIVMALGAVSARTKPLVISLVTFATGVALMGSGAGGYYISAEEWNRAEMEFMLEKSEIKRTIRSFYDLPKYLKIKHGLKSTDPNKHVRVSALSSVYDITIALAQELNNTLHQQQDHTNLNVVEYVCFMKSIGQKECKKPYNL